MSRESGYYPPGAEFDPRAPWNQEDPREFGEQHVEMVCEDLFDTGPGEALLIKVTQLMQDEINGVVAKGEPSIKDQLWAAFSAASDELADLAQERANEDDDWQNPEPPEPPEDY